MTACATGHGAENPPTVLRSASSAATCAEIKFYGVFVLNHRVVLAPDALVDFHTGRDLPNVCIRSIEDAARERGVVFRHAEQQRRGSGRRAPARDPGHARVAAQKLQELLFLGFLLSSIYLFRMACRWLRENKL